MNMVMKYFLIILFQWSVFCLLGQNTNDLLARATPVPEKKREKQKQQNEQREEIIMPVDIEIPVNKTQQEIDEEKTLETNLKWEHYLSERIVEMQQLFSDISQLDSNTVTKDIIEEYSIEVNNLKEKVDFKLGNDPLWKENDELDAMRASFSETHAHTLKKLKYWEEKMNAQKTADNGISSKINKWLIPAMVALGVLTLVMSKIKSVTMLKKTKKQTEKIMQQQQEEAEKQRLLADEKNIIDIN
jgi:cupin superfamily acireductone dioxygenase involved in methionine salvage